MTDTLIHRGPDDQGYYSSGPATLGFRRLSIVDLSTGKQPMSNEDGTVWIVLNGEIYNHADLRPEHRASRTGGGKDLLPAAGVVIEERSAGARRGGHILGGRQQGLRGVPEHIQVARLIAQLDDIGALGGHHADAQLLVFENNQLLPLPGIFIDAAAMIALVIAAQA